jgi:exopolysaccharide biosynthesis polyprenyl glycosylphosphotransferase
MRKFLLLIGDVLMLYTALFLTLVIRYGEGFGAQIDNHIIPFSLVFALGLIIFYIFNIYNIETNKNATSFFSTLANATIIMVAFAAVLFYVVPTFGITPKTNLIIFAFIFIVIESLWRFVFNRIIVESGLKNNTIIVGFNQLAVDLAQYLYNNPQAGYRLKYILDEQNNSAFSLEDVEFKIIAGSKDLKDVLKKEGIRTVVLSPEAYNIPEMVNVFYKNIGDKIVFCNLSNFYEKITARVALDALDQTWFLENLNENSKRAYEVVKRFGDIVGAAAFGAISIVLYPFIMFAIKWESAGSIFYKQKREGRGGRVFEIVKFRTMVTNAEKQGALWAQEDDPRITKVGRFLRKTRIDEFPQLWNILRGDMSFVGPRAERPEFRGRLKKEVPFYEERYLIKPGLSGWAQVKYRYGASVEDTREKLQYDLYYIKHRSIVFDLAIILRTIRIVLAGGGR